MRKAVSGWPVSSSGTAGIRSKPRTVLPGSIWPSPAGLTPSFAICSYPDQWPASLPRHPGKTGFARIIIVAGRTYDIDREAVLEAGGDGYFVKPLKWEKLAEIIKRVRRPRRKLTPRQSRALKFHPPSTRVKLWGVRGSIPVPGPTTIGYGGNTSCVEVRTNGEIIVLDAGSGIRELGLALDKEFGTAPINLTLLLTHTHWDHIQGLPFFIPAYQAKNTIRVLGYEGARAGLADDPGRPDGDAIFSGELERSAEHHEDPGTQEDGVLDRQDVRVRSRFLNHPGHLRRLSALHQGRLDRLLAGQ